ncbi:MAG: hypothetical protein ACKVT1_10020 [Dehalococcoidia bacterium]
MILPRDEVLHAGLPTSFTNFDGLLADLKERGLSGYANFSDAGVEATVLFEAQGAGSAWLRSERGQLAGSEARAEIAARAQQGTGTVDVVKLDSALVRLIVSLEQREVVHRDLSTAFTSPEGLLTKLQGDGLTGCVDIAIDGGRAAATIYLREGAAVAAVFLEDGQPSSGPDAVSRALAAAAAQGARFNVYRPGSGSLEVEPWPSTGAAGAEQVLAPRQALVAPGVNVVGFWSEMLGVAEAVVESLGPPGLFAVAFREARVERADTYPFLDPFAAEFEYRDGAVTWAGPLPAEFSEALGECLQDALARLAFRLKRPDVETRVHAQLAELGGRNAAVMASFPLSVQTLVS